MGPESVTNGSTNRGAIAGPAMVPSPVAPASCERLSVRSSPSVRSAT